MTQTLPDLTALYKGEYALFFHVGKRIIRLDELRSTRSEREGKIGVVQRSEFDGNQILLHVLCPDRTTWIVPAQKSFKWTPPTSSSKPSLALAPADAEGVKALYESLTGKKTTQKEEAEIAKIMAAVPTKKRPPKNKK
jgi:hypothetical protein